MREEVQNMFSCIVKVGKVYEWEKNEKFEKKNGEKVVYIELQKKKMENEEEV